HNLYDILFVDSMLGFIVGGDRYASSDLLVTEDGGENWNLSRLPPDGNKAVYAVAAAENKVLAAGFDGKVFRYDEADKSWSYMQTNWWEWFQGICSTANANSFVVVGIGYQHGRILKMDEEGVVLQADSFDFELTDVTFIDDNTGFTCGYGALLKTSNGGHTWQQLNIKGDFYKSLFYKADGSIWTVGYNGSIIHSTDNGMTWEKSRRGGNIMKKQWRLRDIAFWNTQEGIAVGDKGLVVYTHDGGQNWQELNSLVSADLNSVSFQPHGVAWIAGAEGTLIRMKL